MSNNKTTATTEWFGTRSHSKRQVTFTIFGTQKTLSLPLEVTTKCDEVKHFLAEKLDVEPDKVSFVVKQGSSYRKLADHEEVRACTVRGITDWERQKASYPHPFAIIGAGHQGLKQGLLFLREGMHNFFIYDRLDTVGGVAWVKNANPTSRLQTELGVYHLQYDPSNPIPSMPTWPTRQDLLEHFKQVCEEFGLLPHLRLSTDVMKVTPADGSTSLPETDPQRRHFLLTTPCRGDRGGQSGG